MSHYLLAVYGKEGEEREPPPPAQMQEFMQRVVALEDEMEKTGTWVFGGRLADPGATRLVMTGGIEVDDRAAAADALIAGFYIIEAKDHDAALAWARKVVEAIGAPIEVRPFTATGKVKDQQPPAG